MNLSYECVWVFRYVINKKLIWKLEKKNMLITEGARAIGESFFRNNASPYFPMTNFYVGLYRGSISKATTLPIVPGEPTGNGYARVVCERSNIGWPTVEKNSDGDWTFLSKEMTFLASGGDIGPVNGGFICTSSTSAGILIGAVAMGVEHTILDGAEMIVQLRAKIK